MLIPPKLGGNPWVGIADLNHSLFRCKRPSNRQITRSVGCSCC